MGTKNRGKRNHKKLSLFEIPGGSKTPLIMKVLLSIIYAVILSLVIIFFIGMNPNRSGSLEDCLKWLIFIISLIFIGIVAVWPKVHYKSYKQFAESINLESFFTLSYHKKGDHYEYHQRREYWEEKRLQDSLDNIKKRGDFSHSAKEPGGEDSFDVKS